MMQSVQMWDNKELTVLSGEPVHIPSAPGFFKFLCCQEPNLSFSIVCVDCGLRVCIGPSKSAASEKAFNVFNQAIKHPGIIEYLYYTRQAYLAYLAYVWARAGMYAHSPTQLLTQPRFPLFNHHNIEDL